VEKNVLHDFEVQYTVVTLITLMKVKLII